MKPRSSTYFYAPPTIIDALVSATHEHISSGRALYIRAPTAMMRLKDAAKIFSPRYYEHAFHWPMNEKLDAYIGPAQQRFIPAAATRV